MKLQVKDVSFSYQSNCVLNNINLSFEPMVIALIGPNGAGKSTLIKCIAGVLKPKGKILFDDREVCPSFKEYFTKIMSYLPQASPNHAVITVFEAVLLGMLNSLSFRISNEEKEKVLNVLKLLEIEDLATKYLNELSCGQQQMISIAQAIVKEPKLILLDEPLNSLDIHHQFELLNHIRGITDKNKIISIIAVHDLNLATRYADQVVLLDKGKVYAYGEPKKVLTPEIIRSVYKVDTKVFTDNDGIPMIYPVDVATS